MYQEVLGWPCLGEHQSALSSICILYIYMNCITYYYYILLTVLHIYITYLHELYLFHWTLLPTLPPLPSTAGKIVQEILTQAMTVGQ